MINFNYDKYNDKYYDKYQHDVVRSYSDYKNEVETYD